MRRRLVVVVVLSAAVTLTGCSGVFTSSGGSGAADLRAPSPSGPPNGLEDRSVGAILDASTAAAVKARSVHLVGSIVEKGAKETIDLVLVKGQGAKGSMTTPQGRLSVIVVDGRFYAKAGYHYWKAVSHEKKVAEVMADRWVRVPGELSGKDAVLFLGDFKKIFHEVSVGVKASKGRQAYVDNHRAIGLVDKADRSTLWVSLDGTPYPLRITPYAKDRTPEPMVFSDWDVAVTIKAPKDPLRMSDLR